MTTKRSKKIDIEEALPPNLPGNLPQIYADGIGQVMVGMPVSKLVFHRTVGMDPSTGENVGSPAAVVTLPTAALLEFVLAFNEMAKNGKQGLLKAAADQASKTQELIEQLLSSSDSPSSPIEATVKKPRTKH